MIKELPDISGRVTALVPKGMTGECLRVLLLSWKAREVGEPSTASGPVSNGEDALLLPVERRNGEVPLGVCECLATGLTCQVLGGGGVSLNLFDKLALYHCFISRFISICKYSKNL